MPSDIDEHLPLLAAWVRYLKATRIVELGTREGESTHTLVQAAMKTGGRVITIDKDDCRPRCKWMKGEYEPHIVFIQSDSLMVGMENDSIDLLFIDTNHELQHTTNELMLWAPRVRPGGVILLHDMNCDGVLIAVANFCVENNIEYFYDKRQNGLGGILVCR